MILTINIDPKGIFYFLNEVSTNSKEKMKKNLFYVHCCCSFYEFFHHKKTVKIDYNPSKWSIYHLHLFMLKSLKRFRMEKKIYCV